MSEKEKMLAGELYNANFDEELIKERISVKDKCFEYNNIKPSNTVVAGNPCKVIKKL